MLLQDRVAIVYGAAGPMGSAVSRAFAREGARLFLAGRTQATLDALADELRRGGATVDTAVMDAMDVASTQAHADAVVAQAGRIDISFNAVGIRARQNVPMIDIPLDKLMVSVVDGATTHFVTSLTAARQMVKQGSGVIIFLTATASKETRHEMGGFGVANAAIEGLLRSLAGEVGRQGVRVVGLRANFTPETIPGTRLEDLGPLTEDTINGRLPLLTEVANTAVYLASDWSGAMAGAIVNLSCGAIID